MISPKTNNSLKTPLSTTLPAFSIITLFVVLMILGMAVIPLLSVKLEPIQNTNSLSIGFSWPKTSAELVEQKITAPLEGVLSTLKGIKKINSVSSQGGANIYIELDEHSDVNQARYEAATLIRQLYNKLPPGVSYPRVYANRRSEEESKSIISYTINGSGSALEIQNYAEGFICPKLALLEGVQDVKVYGGSSYVWELQYDPKDLIRYSISASDIENGINQYFSEYELGKAEVLQQGSFAEPEYRYLKLKINRGAEVEWNKIAVKKAGNRTIYLNDVASPRFIEQEPDAFYRINGLNTVNLVVFAHKKANTILLARQVKENMLNIQQHLPAAYSVLLTYDSTEFLKKELTTIGWRSAATIAILLLFVFAASRQLRYLLLIVISLVSNLLLAAILYYFLKLDIHLYSLAAISVSMGMIIDNSIVVIDHIRHKHNMRIILAVAGSTLTTIGAVCIIFFLDEKQQVNLIDFAWIMIINLSISLIISFFFIPALMQKLPLPALPLVKLINRKRRVITWNRFYIRSIGFALRYRRVYALSMILLFGIPVFMLPAKLESQSTWASWYNKTLASDFYNESIRPYSDMILGGTLRLFLSGSERFHYSDVSKERTRVHVQIKMPKGTNPGQMNTIARSFENYLSQFEEIEQFQTTVTSGESATIAILFTPESEKTAFPYALKGELETKAVYTGLADFTITGVGQGFNNELNTETTNYGLSLQGFNYQELRLIAERIKAMLLENPRVEKVSLNSTRDAEGENTNYEFVFQVDKPEKLMINRFSQASLYKTFETFSKTKQAAGAIFYHNEYTPIVLSPIGKSASIWQVMNEPVRSDSGVYVRLKEFAHIGKERTGDVILKENQQYQLVVNYNFIGDYYLGSIVSERIIKKVSQHLPLGYTLKESDNNFWRGSEQKLAWAIFLTIGIVFLICSVMLNSITQPLAVVAMIPISFIGVFLTSYIFAYRFDEGGYAAFIILCGVVVNAALFILNDYNILLKEQVRKPKLMLFLKAYNTKIIPVILSTASMIIGLIPFILYSKNDPFWYALAMSTIGGLVFSLIAIVVFLPLFLRGIKPVQSFPGPGVQTPLSTRLIPSNTTPRNG